MYTEIPMCLRCCFCFPLRYGLLAWGYFKMAFTLLVTFFFLVTLYREIARGMVRANLDIGDIVILSVIVSILLLDIILNIIFIIGAHKKQVALLRAYYFYSMVIWVLSVILMLFSIGKFISHYGISFNEFLFYILLMDFSCWVFYLIIQIYIILLIRSEILKLSNMGQFRFINNAAEAECTLRIEGLHNSEKDNQKQNNEEVEDSNDTRKCEALNGGCGTKQCCKTEKNYERLV